MTQGKKKKAQKEELADTVITGRPTTFLDDMSNAIQHATKGRVIHAAVVDLWITKCMQFSLSGSITIDGTTYKQWKSLRKAVKEAVRIAHYAQPEQADSMSLSSDGEADDRTSGKRIALSAGDDAVVKKELADEVQMGDDFVAAVMAFESVGPKVASKCKELGLLVKAEDGGLKLEYLETAMLRKTNLGFGKVKSMLWAELLGHTVREDIHALQLAEHLVVTCARQLWITLPQYAFELGARAMECITHHSHETSRCTTGLPHLSLKLAFVAQIWPDIKSLEGFLLMRTKFMFGLIQEAQEFCRHQIDTGDPERAAKWEAKPGRHRDTSRQQTFFQFSRGVIFTLNQPPPGVEKTRAWTWFDLSLMI